MCLTKLAALLTTLLPSVLLARFTDEQRILGLFSHSCLFLLWWPPQECEGEVKEGKQGLPRVKTANAVGMVGE